MSRILLELKRITQKLLDLQASILLTVFYFVFAAFPGAFARIFKDYLQLKSPPSWKERQELKDIKEFLKGQ